MRHQDVSDSELVCSDEVATCQPALQVREYPIHPADQKFAVLAAGPVCCPVQHHQALQRRLTSRQRGEAPAYDLCFASRIARHQAAGLLGKVNEDGSRFGQDQTIIIHRRDLLKRAELPISVATQVVRRVVQANHLKRQLHLFKRPQHPQVARMAAGACVDF